MIIFLQKKGPLIKLHLFIPIGNKSIQINNSKLVLKQVLNGFELKRNIKKINKVKYNKMAISKVGLELIILII